MYGRASLDLLRKRAPGAGVPKIICHPDGTDHGAAIAPRLHDALCRVASSVAVSGCEDDDLCFRDDVDEAMLVVNPP
jgi:hypothetical protein